MDAKEFMARLDEARIAAAIAAAERRTSGEVRVFVSRGYPEPDEDIMARAAARFEKLGMTATRHRNGVLIYFMPAIQRFAIIGDTGIHQRCGPEFWESVAGELGGKLAQGQWTEAIVEAVRRAGDLLARHFPPEAGNPNELPNELEGD